MHCTVLDVQEIIFECVIFSNLFFICSMPANGISDGGRKEGREDEEGKKEERRLFHQQDDSFLKY